MYFSVGYSTKITLKSSVFEKFKFASVGLIISIRKIWYRTEKNDVWKFTESILNMNL